MKTFLCVIILSLCVSACREHGRTNLAYIKELNPSDTFLYEFSVNNEGRFDSLEYHHKLEFEQYFKLQSLEKGFDSVQIRISFGCAMGNDILVIISNANNKWTAEVSILNEYFSDGPDKRDIPRKSLFPIPKSGWEKFIHRLFELKILSIEDNGKIPNFYYELPMDGCGVKVEVATKNVYRFYSYGHPDMYSDKYWQAKNVLSILRYINEELNIKTDWPSQENNHKKSEIKKIKIQEITLEPDTTKL